MRKVYDATRERVVTSKADFGTVKKVVEWVQGLARTDCDARSMKFEQMYRGKILQFNADLSCPPAAATTTPIQRICTLLTHRLSWRKTM